MNGYQGGWTRVCSHCRYDFSFAMARLLADLLQTIDVILAWLIAEDDGAKRKIVSLLADRDEDLSLIRGTLQGE